MIPESGPLRSVIAGAVVLILSLGGAALGEAQVDVWIDPGHGLGCGDVGAPGFNGEDPPDERHITLAISQKVATRLSQIGGFTSLLTRNSDHCVTKLDRVRMSVGLIPNDQNDTEVGTIFVSVHADGSDNPNAIGQFVIYMDAKSKKRKRRTSYRADSTLAEFIDPPLQSNAAAAYLGCFNGDREISKRGGLVVLNQSYIPSVLVECGFISNECQFTNIIQDGDQGFIANGIATGAGNYLVSLAAEQARKRPDPAPGEPYAVAGPSAVLAGNLAEGFEGDTFPPAGWTLSSSGASPPFTWHRSTDPLYVNSDVGAALVQGEYGSTIDELLISPMFRVTTADSALRFRWLGSPNFAGDVQGSCEVRRKGESTWTPVWTLGQENLGLGFEFPERVVSLRAWLNDSIQVGFRAAGTNGADFGLDDILTGVFPLTGAPANDLCNLATPFPSGANFSVSGSTCYATNQRDPFDPEAPSCVPEDAAGGDVFYSMIAEAGDTLYARLPGSEAQSTHLYIIDSCDSLGYTCLKGKDSSTTGIDSSLTYVFPSTGTYYLVIDAMQDDCSDFTISGRRIGPVTSVPPSGRAVGLTVVASPNPSRGVTIRFAGQLAAGYGNGGVLRILDASGRTLHVRRLEASGDRFELHWDGRTRTGTTAAPGWYIAKVELNGESASTGFVITK